MTDTHLTQFRIIAHARSRFLSGGFTHLGNVHLGIFFSHGFVTHQNSLRLCLGFLQIFKRQVTGDLMAVFEFQRRRSLGLAGALDSERAAIVKRAAPGRYPPP